MNIIKFFTLFVLLMFVLDGLITLYSIVNSLDGLVINIVGGILFILFGWYFYTKERYFLLFLKDREGEEHFDKIIYMEIVLLALSALFALFVLMAVYHRAFIERYAVFG